MIARMWTGVVRPEDADKYAQYVRETGIDAYASTPGNRGAWLLTRPTEAGTEITTFSLWESEEAIRAFAGEDIEAAVFYPEDDAYLIDRDLRVRHWEVAQAHAPPAGG